MKKILLISVALMFCLISSAQDRVAVKSGDINILLDEKTAVVEFDYSQTKVGTKTLTEYLKFRGDDYLADWPSDIEQAKEQFIRTFNKKTDGLEVKAKDSVIPADYKMVFRILDYNPGSTKTKNIPFVAKRSGGAVLTGYIELYDRKGGACVLKIAVEEVKGASYPADGIRLGYACSAVAKKVLKLL